MPYTFSSRLLTLIMFCWSMTGMSQPSDGDVSLKLVALYVENIESSINWYRDHLGFEIDREIQRFPDYSLRMAFLKKNNFLLELVEKTPNTKRKNLLGADSQYLTGFYKIGFLVNDLDKWYRKLKGKVKIVAEIEELQPPATIKGWPKRYFLVEDVDGNYIQFFTHDSRARVADITPWLMMITVRDLDSMSIWISKKIQLPLLETMREKGNRRAILGQDNFIIELFEPANPTPLSSIKNETSIIGFTKLALGIKNLDDITTQTDLNIVVKESSSDFDWATRAMIIKDPEENWIQFFEVKK